jgi:hypothetical protein
MTSGQDRGSGPGAELPEQMTRADFQRLHDQLRAQPPWGPADRQGALNNLSPATMLAAVGGVKLGRAVSLARPIEYGVTTDNPAPARHQMAQTGDTAPSGGLSFAMDQIGMNIHGNAGRTAPAGPGHGLTGQPDRDLVTALRRQGRGCFHPTGVLVSQARLDRRRDGR